MREAVRDKDRLFHIREAIRRILDFAQGKTLSELEEDNLRFFGIVKNIEIIGEASYKLTSTFKKKHPEVPWEAISKMRHVLVRDYYQIDPKQVWNVINTDLIQLQSQVENMIHTTDWEEWGENEMVIYESAVHKSLIQTASRMKRDGLSPLQISRYTGLSLEEIEDI